MTNQEKQIEVYDKIKGHAVTQSDVEPKDVREKLRYLIIDHIGGCDLRLVQRAHDITDALSDSILSAFPALAQSDAKPGPLAKCTARDVYPSPLDCIYPDCQCERTEAGRRAEAQSDAEPVAWREALKQIANQRLTDEATEEEHEDADYVCGYNECVKIARDALHTAPLRADKAAWLANEAADAEPVCKICGGSGYTRHLGRDNSEEVEDCSCQSSTKATTHSLERTNPKGQNFIGRCVLCGATNLPAKAALWPCQNPRQVSQEDMLVEAIEGPADRSGK
jgi:hypothetical protein